jgi:predicted RecA/RadA family phage recombinase
MAINQVFHDSDELSLPVGTGIKSGEPVRVGIINGVAMTDSGDLVGTGTGVNMRSNINTTNFSGYATVWSHGVWNLTVALAADRAAGTAIYCTFPGANKKVALTDNSNSGANKLWGFLYLDSKSGTAVVAVAVVPAAA